MPKPKKVPFSQMKEISDSGVFIKHFGQYGKAAMKPYAHRDDYYIIALLTDGMAAVEIDFDRKQLRSGDILIVSPWQIHNKPSGEIWQADGWMLAISPEMLSEAETHAIERYSVSPHSFSPGKNIVEDIDSLCYMLERHKNNHDISISLASAIKSIVLTTLDTSDKDISERYRSITLKLRKLLDTHLTDEKRPAAYASMLNISEVYLNEAVKGATGLSVGAYIRNRSIIQARRQLAYTSMSVKEIAFALGYNDYAYFSKLFKKSVGKSPMEYRKNLK